MRLLLYRNKDPMKVENRPYGILGYCSDVVHPSRLLWKIM